LPARHGHAEPIEEDRPTYHSGGELHQVIRVDGLGRRPVAVFALTLGRGEEIRQ
jgi:hypothetical protein